MDSQLSLVKQPADQDGGAERDGADRFQVEVSGL